MESVTPGKSLRDHLESILLKGKALAFSLLHLPDLFQVLKLRRQHEGIQLKRAEIIKIYRAIQSFKTCNMLVFGLGNDSPFWCGANSHGRTVFLEDFQPWYDKITAKYPDIEAYPVSYPNNITQWEEMLDQPGQLEMKLPEEVNSQTWDVILVDGPRGHKYSPEIPGRMSSIYSASRLVGEKGYVFVHDAQRTIENAYSSRYLGQERFVEKVRGRALLLIYRF